MTALPRVENHMILDTLAVCDGRMDGRTSLRLSHSVAQLSVTITDPTMNINTKNLRRFITVKAHCS